MHAQVLFRRGRRIRTQRHDCYWPLTPFRVGFGDDSDLGDRGMLGEQILGLERGDPFAAGLDDVLDAVGDLQRAVRPDVPDVAGVQITVLPQAFGCRRISAIGLRQPRRTYDDFPRRATVVRQRREIGRH